MSGSGWVTTPSWLSSSLRSFFEQFFCVFLPSLLDLFCFYKVFTNLSFIVPIFGWNILLIFLIFLKILLVFPLLFFFSPISLHLSLMKAFCLLDILWNFCTSRTNLPVIPGISWFLTFALQFLWRIGHLLVSVLGGLLGLHRTDQLQLL